VTAQIERVNLKVKEQTPHEVESPQDPLPNARLFVNERYPHRVRPLIIHQGGTFYAWNGRCWPEELEDGVLRAQLYRFFEHAYWMKPIAKGPLEQVPFQPSRRKIDDLIHALRAVDHLPVTTSAPSWLENNPLEPSELVTCANGLIHVPTRILHDAAPAFFVHHAVRFDFLPNAGAPTRWLEFLHELWEDDQESVDTLQEVFGYLVSGDTRLQNIFLLIGPKRSGKGTVARVAKSDDRRPPRRRPHSGEPVYQLRHLPAHRPGRGHRLRCPPAFLGYRRRDLRAQQLREHPYCQCPHCRGKWTEAEVVDHIRPHNGDTRLFFAKSNLQSLTPNVTTAGRRARSVAVLGFLLVLMKVASRCLASIRGMQSDATGSLWTMFSDAPGRGGECAF
jgi:hypothetical protein